MTSVNYIIDGSRHYNTVLQDNESVLRSIMVFLETYNNHNGSNIPFWQIHHEMVVNEGYKPDDGDFLTKFINSLKVHSVIITVQRNTDNVAPEKLGNIFMEIFYFGKADGKTIITREVWNDFDKQQLYARNPENGYINLFDAFYYKSVVRVDKLATSDDRYFRMMKLQGYERLLELMDNHIKNGVPGN